MHEVVVIWNSSVLCGCCNWNIFLVCICCANYNCYSCCFTFQLYLECL